MNTRITIDESSITVATEFRRAHYFDAGFREMVRAYHGARAGQALENAIDNGCTYLSTELANKEYWEDANLARKDAMILFTRFIVRTPMNTQAIVDTPSTAPSNCICGGEPHASHCPACPDPFLRGLL